MTRQKKVIKALLPFSWFYGLMLEARNFMYDRGILKSYKSPLKTVVIGNLAAGGTGKTPHVAWLARLLGENSNVAILSRGYKRKSKGFRWVSIDDHPDIAGDEPLELKSTLPTIPVAVDSNRIKALERMNEELNPPPDFVILDDGFQHRSLIPAYSIILTRSGRPLYSDSMIPAGRLREPISAIKRANAIIVTDSEKVLGDLAKYREKLKISDDQILLSSSYRYRELIPLTDKAKETRPDESDSWLVIAGVAGHVDLEKEMEGILVSYISFPDHHRYKQKDFDRIISSFNTMPGDSKILVTTGKDSVKLTKFTGMNELPLYSLTREILMDPGQQSLLISSILKNG